MEQVKATNEQDDEGVAVNLPPFHFEHYAHCESGHVPPYDGPKHRKSADAQTDADNHNNGHEDRYNKTPGAATVKTVEVAGP